MNSYGEPDRPIIDPALIEQPDQTSPMKFVPISTTTFANLYASFLNFLKTDTQFYGTTPPSIEFLPEWLTLQEVEHSPQPFFLIGEWPFGEGQDAERYPSCSRCKHLVCVPQEHNICRRNENGHPHSSAKAVLACSCLLCCKCTYEMIFPLRKPFENICPACKGHIIDQASPSLQAQCENLDYILDEIDRQDLTVNDVHYVLAKKAALFKEYVPVIEGEHRELHRLSSKLAVEEKAKGSSTRAARHVVRAYEVSAAAYVVRFMASWLKWRYLKDDQRANTPVPTMPDHITQRIQTLRTFRETTDPRRLQALLSQLQNSAGPSDGWDRGHRGGGA